MELQKIASDTGLSPSDREAFYDHANELATLGPADLEREMTRIMASEDYRSPASQHHALSKAMLIATVDRRENPSGHSRPTGNTANTIGDLIDPSKARASLRNIEAQIDKAKQEGVAEDNPKYKQLLTMKQDVEANIEKLTETQTRVNDAAVKQAGERHDASVESEAAEKKQFFDTQLAELQRIGTPPEQAQQMTEQRWTRYRNRY